MFVPLAQESTFKSLSTIKRTMKKKHTFRGCHVGCPVEASLEVIGGKWKGMLLYHIMIADGPVRFSELERALKNATRRMLTRQLKELQEDGIILRTAYPEVPPRVEYSLTEKGDTLRPVIELLKGWGEEHVLDEDGRRLRPSALGS